MNNVTLIGYLTKDPIFSDSSKTPVANFILAVKRPFATPNSYDYLQITAFNKVARTCEKYIHKGDQIAVHGRIHSSSYINRSNVKTYATNVIADQIKFLNLKDVESTIPGLEPINDDIPF